MADAEKIMQGLAQIAVEHPGCDDVISAAITLIVLTLVSEPIRVVLRGYLLPFR